MFQVTRCIPLFAASSTLDREAVFSDDRAWTWRDIHVASSILSARLVGKDIVVNMCESYVGFLVTWLAVIRCGSLQILPGSDKRTDIDNTLLSVEKSIVVFDAKTELMDWIKNYQGVFWEPNTCDTLVATSTLELPDLWERSRICLYTSGSTGVPQPELKTINQLITGAQVLGARISQELGVSLEQVAYLVSSVAPCHMFGIEAVLMLSLVHGVAVLDRRPLLPADVSDALQLIPGGALWITTPLHMRALARNRSQVRSCRAVISSTMPLDKATALRIQQLFQAPVIEVYGSTETGAIATRMTSRTDDWQLLVGVRIKSDAFGLWVRSGHNELSRRLHDIVQPVTADRFRLIGRRNDVIKVAGQRASLAGLNLIVQSTPGFEESVLYVPPSGTTDQRPVLIYAGERLGYRRIKAAFEKKMVSVFIPRTLIHVEQLPISVSGKVILQDLDQIYKTWLSQKNAEEYLGTCTGYLMDA